MENQELYSYLKKLNETISKTESQDIPDLFNQRGITYFKLGRYHDALEDFSSCIRLSGAIDHILLGIYKSALLDYETALKISPKYVDGWNNRGVTFFEMGGNENYWRSLICYNKALEIDNQDVFTYFNRGVTYSEMSRFDEAIEDFTEVMKRSPNDVESLLMRARMYLQVEEYENAKNDFEKILKVDGSPNGDNFEEISYELQNVKDIILKKKKEEEEEEEKRQKQKQKEEEEQLKSNSNLDNDVELISKNKLIPISSPTSSFENFHLQKMKKDLDNININAKEEEGEEKELKKKISYQEELQDMKKRQIKLISQMREMKSKYDEELSNLGKDRNELRSWNIEITKNLNKWSYTARQLNEELKELKKMYHKERKTSEELLKETTRLKFVIREKEQIINQFRIYRVITENELKKREKNLISSLQAKFESQQQQQQMKMRENMEKEKEKEDGDEGTICVLCYENPRNCALVDCGHTLCLACYKKLDLRDKKTCPFCCQRYFRMMKIFL